MSLPWESPLQRWIEAGLLDRDAAARIRAWESERPGAHAEMAGLARAWLGWPPARRGYSALRRRALGRSRAGSTIPFRSTFPIRPCVRQERSCGPRSRSPAGDRPARSGSRSATMGPSRLSRSADARGTVPRCPESMLKVRPSGSMMRHVSGLPGAASSRRSDAHPPPAHAPRHRAGCLAAGVPPACRHPVPRSVRPPAAARRGRPGLSAGSLWRGRGSRR